MTATWSGWPATAIRPRSGCWSNGTCRWPAPARPGCARSRTTPTTPCRTRSCRRSSRWTGCATPTGSPAGWAASWPTSAAPSGAAPPLTLLGDWPENLHPASAGNLPSAEDLDRADALSRAVAGLPPGQRHAVTLFYYADQPAGQIAATPGAAKASLHKARRRLREYITAHRPDLIPAVSRRIPMTAVRIAHADPWPGRTPEGRMDIDHVLVILADDAGHRALPVRLPRHDGKLWGLLARPEDRGEELLTIMPRRRPAGCCRRPGSPWPA